MATDKLTPKQEAFCLAYIDQGNASEAYRKTYAVAKMQGATVNRSAFELIENPKIATRIAELRSVAADAASMTLAGHLTDLKALRDAATAEGKYAAAIAAEIARGKASGFYVEKVEHSGAVAMPVLNVILSH